MINKLSEIDVSSLTAEERKKLKELEVYIYDSLYKLWKERVKVKRYSYEAYIFELNAGERLEIMSRSIAMQIWDMIGYHSFYVYKPKRLINASSYEDRIGEQWLTEYFLAPGLKDRFIKMNLASQKGKSPFDGMEELKKVLTKMYEQYGTNFYIYQFDFKGYYDNLVQSRIKESISKIDIAMPIWNLTSEEFSKICLHMVDIIINSYYSEEYSYRVNPNRVYGLTKGSITSQWFGIDYLNELDHILAEDTSSVSYQR